MANSDTKNGLVPVSHARGGDHTRINSVCRNWTIRAAQTDSIFKGDLVKRLSGDTIALDLAASGDVVIGVFRGVSYTDSDGKPVYSKYWDGAGTGRTNIVAEVCDDPDVIYAVQAADAAVAASLYGTLVDATVASPNGSTLTGLSYTEANVGASSNDDFLVLDYKNDGKNDSASADSTIFVMLNKHELGPRLS